MIKIKIPPCKAGDSVGVNKILSDNAAQKINAAIAEWLNSDEAQSQIREQMKPQARVSHSYTFKFKTGYKPR